MTGQKMIGVNDTRIEQYHIENGNNNRRQVEFRPVSLNTDINRRVANLDGILDDRCLSIEPSQDGQSR